ncbi:SWIM zinc finger family protein [Peribacillus deserti]|uniref:SWIM-type domain-containing protein n=1 Tax=Peribacillus deserti TaxID=673318 RepID=A0A2N5MBL0_9BACI|nr:SWIM zinc finger family protein [Peribacillus deserti]PLT31737.1 hypothetical protein CUU66_00810 [Peribacillus deserti]
MEVLHVGEALLEVLNPHDEVVQVSVQQGFSLYTQGLVYRLADYEDHVTATVQDLVPAKVVFDMNNPANSSCSCDDGLMCRHQIAVFLAAYSKRASVRLWIDRWKSKQEEAEAPIEEETLALTSARDVLEQKKTFKRSFSSWKGYIDKTFDRYILKNKTMPEYMLDRMWGSFNQKLKEKAPIEREWRHLYDFVSLYVVLLNCLKLIKSDPSPKVSLSFFHDLASNSAEELQEIIPSIGRQAQPFAFDEFLEGIKDEAWQLLEGGSSLQYERVDFYRSLWRYLLKKSAWRSKEIKRLEEALNEKHSEAQTASYQIALIHLLLLTNQDEQAMELLGGLQASASPFLYAWLQYSIETGNEKRAALFIEHVIKRVNPFLSALVSYYERTDFVRTFSMPIRVFCQETKRSDLLERFYRETLPYSYYEYSRVLFDREEYQKWVELQMFSGETLTLTGNESLKILQAKEPSLLLPLYHHAVLSNLEQKNRQAYKAAVRYLKKLKALYKKLKQENRWDEYIENLSVSTKRLRAFQEELQRGKLIHVE